MKRLLTAITLCAAALIGADAATSPAAAGGRHGDRHQVERHDRQQTWNNSHRDRRFKLRRHHRIDRRKFRRHFRGHRQFHNHGYGYGHWQGRPRRHGMRHSGSFLFGHSFLPNGTRIVIRLD